MIILTIISITYFLLLYFSYFRNVETFNKNDRKNTFSYNIRLKAKILIENIPDRSTLLIRLVFYLCYTKSNLLIRLSYKIITYAFCFPCTYSFGLIYLYFPYVLKILPRLLMKKYIKKKKNIAIT